MSKRTLPDWQYAHPDGRNQRIKELEAQLVILRGVIEVARKRLAKYEKKKACK